ncbi:hypothetical protein ACFL3T_00875 [Patescibacteria group bacterium]
MVVVVSGLFYVFLNAPTRYFIGSLFTRPQTIMVEDVKSGAFTIEYINAFKTEEVSLGASNVNIGDFNLNSSYEPIEAHSLNFVFESPAKDMIKNLTLIVDDEFYENVEFIWLDNHTLSLSFGADPLIIKDTRNIKINADFTDIKTQSSVMVMHFSFADLTGSATKQVILNQGIINDTPDPKPQSIIFN